MIKLCDLTDLQPGTIIRVLPEQATLPLSLVKVDENVFCFEDICSHETASLAEGWLEGYEVECPLHESRFDIRTGRPDCPPARKPIRTHRVHVIDDIVYLEESSIALLQEPA